MALAAVVDIYLKSASLKIVEALIFNGTHMPIYVEDCLFGDRLGLSRGSNAEHTNSSLPHFYLKAQHQYKGVRFGRTHRTNHVLDPSHFVVTTSSFRSFVSWQQDPLLSRAQLGRQHQS